MRKHVQILYTHDFTRGWTLGSHPGLLSVVVADSSGKGVFPFLGDSASKCVEAIVFFLPLAGGSAFLLFLVLFGGRAGLGVFGYRVRSSLATTAAPGLFDLFLAFFLRCLVRHRDQHLRQKWAGWFFWQRGRAVDPSCLLRPALGELWKNTLSVSLGLCR